PKTLYCGYYTPAFCPSATRSCLPVLLAVQFLFWPNSPYVVVDIRHQPLSNIVVVTRHYDASPRHPGSADSSHASTGADARMGDLRADTAGFSGRPAGQPGLVVSGAASPGATGLDPGRMGDIRAGPAGAVLPVDRFR